MISVVMSVYNEKIIELQASIESILAQTYADFEYIIVLDNPTNQEARELLSEYQKRDSRIRLIYNESNIGLALSLNKAIAISKGEYIARMDADDISFPDRFEKELSIMKEKLHVDVVASNVIEIDENGKKRTASRYIINNCMAFKKAIAFGNVIVHPTVLIRREILEKVGGYRDFKTSQDYDLWLRLVKKGAQFYTITEPLLYYRVRSASITMSNPGRQRGFHKYAQYLYKTEYEQDLFSIEGEEEYLKRIALFSKEEQNSYNEAYKILTNGISQINNGELWKGFKQVFLAMVKHKEIVWYIYDAFCFKKTTNKYKIKGVKDGNKQ